MLDDVLAMPMPTAAGDEVDVVQLRYRCAKRSLHFSEAVAGVDLETEEERFDNELGRQALAMETVRIGWAPTTLRTLNDVAKCYDLAWYEGGTHVELSAFGYAKDEVIAIAESMH
jgi:hypothetical protein